MSEVHCLNFSLHLESQPLQLQNSSGELKAYFSVASLAWPNVTKNSCPWHLATSALFTCCVNKQRLKTI